MTTETLASHRFFVNAARQTRALSPGDAADKRTARIAGMFYLLVGIFGGFAVGFVEPKMYANGDAAAALQAVIANAGLLRAGVVTDLLNQVFFVALAITLYDLLKGIHAGAARAMIVLVVAAAIASLNTIFLFEALQVGTQGSFGAAFGAPGVEALVALLLDMQHYCLLAAQVFFGLWLAPLGYLLLKSGRFPKPLGIALIVAAACYIVDLVVAFLTPDLGEAIHGGVVVPCAIAEIWMVLYLLIIGVRPHRTEEQHNAVDDDLCS